MRGLCRYCAAYPFAVFIAHKHARAGQGILAPAAKLKEAQRAVGLYGMDYEAHLVAVRVKHEYGLIARVRTPVYIKIAKAVLFKIANVR